MYYRYSLFILFTVFILGGCTSTGELFVQKSPVTGTWDYRINSPDGIFTGTLSIRDSDEGLLVELSVTDQEETSQGESVEFNQDDQSLSFSFDTSEYGRMHVSMTLGEDDELKGTLHVVEFQLDVPMTATRSDQ